MNFNKIGLAEELLPSSLSTLRSEGEFATLDKSYCSRKVK